MEKDIKYKTLTDQIDDIFSKGEDIEQIKEAIMLLAERIEILQIFS